MNKNDLIESMSEEFELTRSFARDLVDRVFERMTEAANQGEEVAIHGFGKFKVVERGFEAAKAMKEGLNTKRRARKKG
jgi:DNA-binding protein HU-beta